jgi:electron transfer flavoprotein alpha subunit
MIVVAIEHEAGSVLDVSLQALAFARGLGEPLHAVAFGEGGARALAAAGAHGIATGTHVRIDGGYAPAAWAAALADIADATAASAVVAAGTDRGNELLAHLGARTGAPFVANCIVAGRTGDDWEVTRQRWGGSLLEDARTSSARALFSVALHTVAAEASEERGVVQVDELAPAVAEEDLRVRATLAEHDTAAAVSLAEARVVVGGGRGVGSVDAFAPLDALASALGGAVGVSRAVTSAGWRPHADQVGQTGERIAPDLYIACGISGASQHMVGCRGAKALLAINIDPEAPILARSDYAVIGDLHEVVPAVVDELQRRGA